MAKGNRFKDKDQKKERKPGRIRRAVQGFRRFTVDERVRKIFGLTCLLTSVILLISMSSFLFTWENDQDKISSSWSDLLSSRDAQIDNNGGSLGALLSHILIHQWFGIASFGFIFLFLLMGLRSLFKVQFLPFKKTFTYTLFFMIWCSVFFGAIFQTRYLFMGGGFGYFIAGWLQSFIGVFGSYLALAFIMLTFLVAAFNISLKLPALPSGKKPEEPESEEEEPEDIPDALNTVKAAPAEPEEESPLPEEEPPAEPEELDLAPVMPEEPEEPEPTGDDGIDFSIEEQPAGETEQEAPEADTTEGPPMAEYDPTLELSSYKFPPADLLEEHGEGVIQVNKDELEANKNRIVDTLGNYNIKIAKIKATIGPTVTLYEIIPEAGVRISKIKNLEDDIALSLSALGIRIIAPIPGRGTIGIEVPNQNPQIVSMRSLIESEKFQHTKMDLPMVLGRTISNEIYIADLTKMPHVLVAGATGQGKSVGLNAMLVSLLYKKHPSQVKFVLVDPKKVELTLFRHIERHFLAKLPDAEEPIITDTNKVINTVKSLTIEMDQRYDLLKNAGARTIKEYNAKFVARKLNPNEGHRYLPYIVLVIDEFADLIMTAGKEIETPIARLAQLARAIGIHLIIATQRPSVNIITGTIKANFPSRIAFRVTSKVDSRTILDAGGADQLIGRGDLLLSTGSEVIRIQCAFLDTPEVERVTEFIGNQRGYADAHLLPEFVDETAEGSGTLNPDDRDSMFEDAARIVVVHQQGSASLLQRRLKLGYNRAGRIIDQLEAAGIIGPFEGSKARQVLIPDEMALEQFLNSQRSNDEGNEAPLS
ncbi:MAG: DNA translocase FtsK 4TM domain-containing protein [Flavobacteriales bacterium]|nr:DNA translocase FtsK 4TM domain-containing protein [Flavobacteriales bacterium]MCB9447921.1 DNA translocase FtsK 4TM domain-containing protein [Flavobacteriales bacterium]